ncbi:MAG: hypothetical protein KDJ77_05655, partial [Rhodobiaceae bacterium]|nr:hypothetical protein [Rhodobiaceae bacterium]
LYDQLQLVQILDDLSRHFGRTEGIRLIQADDYLGHYSPETIGQFAGAARPVDSGMIKTAQALWKALCAPTPEPVAERAAAPVAGFPFMQAALLRFLQELPGRDGLSRTQRTMLEVIDAEPTTAGRLFGAVIAKEEAQFMGDATFFADLDALAFCAVPALAGLPCPSTGLMDPEAGDDGRSAYMQSKPALTPLGTAILAGEADFLGENSIDRWWGGTHLRDGNVWRIDRDTGDLVHP